MTDDLLKTDVADEINMLHEEIQTILESVKSQAMGKAIRIGELLSSQKKVLPHGSFGDWIQEKLPFDVRQAQRYMRAFENQDVLNASCKTHLSLTGAMEYLAETKGQDESSNKSTPEDEAIDKLFPWVRDVFSCEFPETFKEELKNMKWRLKQESWESFYSKMAVKEAIDSDEKLAAFIERQTDEWSEPDGSCYESLIARAFITGYALRLMYELAMVA